MTASGVDIDILAASELLLQKLTPNDLDATLSAITSAAVEVLPHVQYASVTMRRRDGVLDSYALTDDLLKVVDAQQFELQEGPCYDATTDVLYTVSSDLSSDRRYPRYGPVAVAVGIRSQAGLRLFDTHRTTGALNLYSEEVGAFDDLEVVNQLFAHQAAVALSYSIEITTLTEAVEARTRIGEAVGIVMERYRIPEQQAFAFLTRLSQNRNIKVRQIADQIIEAVANPPKVA